MISGLLYWYLTLLFMCLLMIWIFLLSELYMWHWLSWCWKLLTLLKFYIIILLNLLSPLIEPIIFNFIGSVAFFIHSFVNIILIFFIVELPDVLEHFKNWNAMYTNEKLSQSSNGFFGLRMSTTLPLFIKKIILLFFHLQSL